MRIYVEDNPYLGTVSRPPWTRPQPGLECQRCGSSLHGRREAVRSIAGTAEVELFRCRCGRSRRITREVAA